MNMQQNIGTCIVLVNDEGNILLGKRKNAYKAGLYGLPGGRIELNETISDAVHRECLEETGLDLGHVDYVGVVRENQGEYDFIHFVFTAQVGDAKIELCEPDKCESWEWVSAEFIAENEEEILPGHLAGIKLFLEKNRLADLTK